METNSLTHRTLKNISYRFTAYTWPIIFSIFVTPIIVLKLGVKEYGIYVFVSTITGLLGLLDLGVSTAVTKYLAEYYGGQDEKKMTTLISSANSLFLLVGLIGLGITMILVLGGQWFFPNRIDNESYYLLIFLLAGLNFFVSSINTLYNLIPDAIQHFAVSAKLNIIYLTLSALVNLAVVEIGYGIKGIFIAQIILTVIFLFIRRRAALQILPLAHYRFGWEWTEIKKCYRFGLATIINNTASTSLAYLDRLIIPLFIGPSQLTYYSLPGNVGARIPGVTDNLSGIIFPLTAGLHGGGEHERIKRLYIRSVRLITIIASAISLSIIFLADPILRYWLSADFADNSTGILIILTITNFIIALLSPITSFFFGLGKIKFSSLLSIVMAVLNALFLLILLPRYGIIGAAWAYLLSVLPIFYMIYFIEQKYLFLTNRGRYYLAIISKILITGSIFYITVDFLIAPWIKNLPTLIIGGPLTVIIFLTLYWLLEFYDQEDEQDLKKFIQLTRQKFFPPRNHG